MKQYTFVIDCDRCIGCKGCQVACKLQSGEALGQGRSKVCTIGPSGVYPRLQMYFLPAMCQQCSQPACTGVCPSGAIQKDEADGIVKIHPAKCIGCGACMRACPYACIHMNKELQTADKCELCAALREKGGAPACVRNCSGGALHFGDVNDPESEVSRLLAETDPAHIFTLRDFGNAPTVRYILRRGDWKDVLPQACVEHSAWKKEGGKT